ncbi:MAG: response regulator transcription factor [Bacilli bacterium]|nr:response regulator transcription factor [Bacilli bacterium]
MNTILIVEDEKKLRDELSKFLENNGYTTVSIINFENTIIDINKYNVDAIILDINLPVVNGQIICKELRKLENNTPIIMVTSKNTEIDELISINFGADDYITKPYNPQILLARLERIITRNKKQDNKIKYKDIELNISKSTISNENKSIDLSKNEFKILYFLLQNKDKIVSREEIINYLWDNDEFVDDNTLTVNINRLRNKLSEFHLGDNLETRRGQGYILS